jgi:hypothetical protein
MDKFLNDLNELMQKHNIKSIKPKSIRAVFDINNIDSFSLYWDIDYKIGVDKNVSKSKKCKNNN